MDATTKKLPATVGQIVERLPATEAGALALLDEQREPAAVEQPATLLAAIINVSCDPRLDVTKLQALMDMQERLESRQAEREFIAAYGRLSGKLPRVKKNGTIDLGKKNADGSAQAIAFAKWEDMDKVIRPLMAAEGFSLSFNSAARTETGGGLVVTGTLMHRDGHSRSASMPLPLDTGPGRNNLQAQGSTLSYGRRYCAEMLLNIVREGADDDGKTGADLGMINDKQKAELVDLMRQAGTLVNPEKLQARFFAKFKIEALDDLAASAFPDAKAALVETINANKKPDAA